LLGNLSRGLGCLSSIHLGEATFYFPTFKLSRLLVFSSFGLLSSSAFLELPLGIVRARWIKAVPVAFLPASPQLQTITSEQTGK
jgi:hypothetical protein